MTALRYSLPIRVYTYNYVPLKSLIGWYNCFILYYYYYYYYYFLICFLLPFFLFFCSVKSLKKLSSATMQLSTKKCILTYSGAVMFAFGFTLISVGKDYFNLPYSASATYDPPRVVRAIPHWCGVLVSRGSSH